MPATATVADAQPTPATPEFLPSTESTTFMGPNGAYTITLPPPWIALDTPTGHPTVELTALRPTELGEPLALLTVETAPTDGITLEQQLAAAARELAATAITHIEQSEIDYTYRLIDRPLGILDYTMEYPGAEPNMAGRQYTIYATRPTRFQVLTFTGKPADLTALREDLELIIARLDTAE